MSSGDREHAPQPASKTPSAPRGSCPEAKARELNELFSATFASVLRIEEHELDNRLTEGLTISELHTIAAVGLSEPRPMNAIASTLHVTLATVTAAINKLEQKGYVERARNPEDRRQVLVSLTGKGRRAYRAHDMFHAKMVARALSSMTESETDALMEALKQLVAFFNEENTIADKRLEKKRDAARTAVPSAAGPHASHKQHVVLPGHVPGADRMGMKSKGTRMATIDSIRSILNDNLDIEPESVQPETTFESLDIDSLDMTELVCAVEEEFDIELDDLEDIETVDDLVERIDFLC